LPDCAPHKVTQNNPLQGDEDDALSHPLDEAFDNWPPADTERFVAMSGCDNDWLKSCIIAASTLIWSVHEMYPAQLDTVYHLLHLMRPKCLAVIQQTGAVGVKHIDKLFDANKQVYYNLLEQCCGLCTTNDCKQQRRRTTTATNDNNNKQLQQITTMTNNNNDKQQ